MATATALNASGDAHGVLDLLRLFESDPVDQSLTGRIRALFGKPPPQPTSHSPEKAAEIVRRLPGRIRQRVVPSLVNALAIHGETTLALNLADEIADGGSRAQDLTAAAAMLRRGRHKTHSFGKRSSRHAASQTDGNAARR